MDELLRPAEVARMLGVSRTWLYAAAADGRVPSIRLGGPDGPVRFLRADLDRWLADARAAWTPGRSRSASDAALDQPLSRTGPSQA